MPDTGYFRAGLTPTRFTLDVSGGGEMSLPSETAINGTLVLLGTLTADRTVRVPVGAESAGLTWQVDNLTSGAFALRFAGQTGSGVTIPQGRGTRPHWNSAQMQTLEDDALRHDAAALTLTTTSDLTLSRVQYKCGLILLAGTPGGAVNVICPTSTGIYIVSNQSNVTITFKTAAGTGVALTTTQVGLLFCNGVDVQAVSKGTLITS